MSQPKHYTANDIERYHSGQLSAAEMHAMEKAALDDPFLADALEGYTFTKTPAGDLTVLQQKLQLRIEKEPKRRGLFYIGSQWMKIAALFIVIAGGGWLVFRTFSDDKNLETTGLATNQPEQKQTPSIPELPVADSTATVFSAPETGDSNSDTEGGQESAVGSGVKATDPVIVQNVPELEAMKKEVFADRVAVDSSLQGRVPGVVTFQTATAPDSLTRRSNIVARNQGITAATAPPRSDTIRNVNVVMQRSEDNLAEVVVINKNKIAERKDARSRMKLNVDTLEPAEGWTYFDDYIANNLKQPEELKTKPGQGEVELTFDINKNGEPVNITVVKSLCQKCDEEAIRLLREGPKWKKGKKKGKVTIRF